MNISSVIVKVQLESFEQSLKAIEALEYVEVGAFDREKQVIIALIEAPSVQEELRANKEIENIPGVLSAHMHFSYSDENPLPPNIQASLEKIENTDTKAVRYSGDINNWL
ncbi:chaperone NapD [Helicobacter felis]|uniref:Chaperone NapD n=1 Tax=Helicobacter felis (strain ATCC 49179 / CCUG 28539 / NCTC 12436 / CS1) TaxID=936155 RepID=E7A9K1_HELFC|nr:chaperone NapD [Helicobacter felis]CBY82527.1 putative periplasmic nitrate reductase component, NapD [Helicobacter felis ATCC 49179]